MTITAARRSANHWPGLDVLPDRPPRPRLGAGRPDPVRDGRQPARRHRPRRRRDLRPRRTGHGREPPRGVLPPARPRPADRLRRGLPDRRLGRRGPRRLPHRAGRPDAAPGPRAAAEAARPRRAQAPRGGAQQHRELAGQHRPPLRPVQRALRAVPRPDAELLLRAVPARPARRLGHGAGPRDRPGPQDRAAARPGRRHRGLPGARDRLGLGRAGDPGRPARRDRPHHHALDRAEGAGRRADRRSRAVGPGVGRAVRLPRRRRASTTPWCRSR